MNKQTCIKCAHSRTTTSSVLWCKRRDRFMPDLKIARMPWCEFDSNRVIGIPTERINNEEDDYNSHYKN